MTTAKMMKNKTGDFIGFEVSGHAGFARLGQDIVCAAISTIAQATIIGLTSVLGLPNIEEVNDGYLSFKLYMCNCEACHDAQVLFKTMYNTLLEIEDQYGEYLEVEVAEN
jgi:uncharacterized protein YsxB (DUF464 family)